MPRLDAASISIRSSAEPGRHLDARLAFVARLRGIARAARAVQRLGEQARRRGLPRPPAPAEQVRVRDARADDRALQRSRGSLLPDQVAEGLRAVLAVEALVFRHANSNGRAPPPRSKTPSSHRGPRLRPGWLRHPRVSPYRCFLPDLTGFGDPSCAGPDLQRRSPRPGVRTQTSAREFGPAKADCRFRVPPAPHLARPSAILPGLGNHNRPPRNQCRDARTSRSWRSGSPPRRRSRRWSRPGRGTGTGTRRRPAR